jgi:hypothetical protein
MKVLFQKPRCATATFNVSAPAPGAAATLDRPTSKANIVLMAFSHPIAADDYFFAFLPHLLFGMTAAARKGRAQRGPARGAS